MLNHAIGWESHPLYSCTFADMLKQNNLSIELRKANTTELVVKSEKPDQENSLKLKSQHVNK